VNDAALTFGSTILGAVIAGVISWLLARRTSKETLQRDREQRRDEKLGLALQAHVKLKTIIDNLGTLLRMIERALANPPAPGSRPWMCVEPIIGHRGEHAVEFTAAELALFLEAQRGDLANDMQLLVRRNATAGVVLETYNARRADLKSKMPPPQMIQGTHGTTALTKDQAQTLAPDMVALDSLIDQLVPALREDLALGLTIAEEFGPVLKKHFGDKRFPGFLIPQQDPQQDRGETGSRSPPVPGPPVPGG
jgi:hypothetical protein